MRAPDITWAMDDVPVKVTDWSANSIANGGFDQCRGRMTESQWNKLQVTPKQGSIVTAYLPNGKVMWEGRLSSPPHFDEGFAHFVAQGLKVILERDFTRRNYITRDYSLWSPAGDPPFDLQQDEDIFAEAKNSSLVFRSQGGFAHSSGMTAQLVIWMPGTIIHRVAFTHVKNRTHASLDIRVQRFQGPTGGRTAIADYNDAAGSTAHTLVVGGTPDAISIGQRWSAAATPTNDQVSRITNLRVSGTVDGTGYTDSTTTGLVLDALADALGYYVAVSTMPEAVTIPALDWEGSASDLCDYVCMLEDGVWRVLAREYDPVNLEVRPRFESFPWSSATNWTCSRSTGAQLDLTPMEVFNKVIVSYPTFARMREASAVASPDPLSGTSMDAATGNPNVFYEELEDVQADSTMANTVRTYLLSNYSQQRYEGSIELTSAKDVDGRDAAWEVKAGDTVTVTDWGPGENKTLRVKEVEYTPEGVSLGIEQDVSSERLLALAGLRTQESRRKRKRRG